MPVREFVPAWCVVRGDAQCWCGLLFHVFQEIDNVIITPHVGSRTYESIRRQAMRATENLVNFLQGKEDYIQANRW